MVDNYLKQSALAPLKLNARTQTDEPTGVELGETAFFGQIGLRLDASNKEICDLAERGLGFALPVKANSATTKGQKSALWLGPDEWLLVMPAEQTAKQLQVLIKALDGQHAAVFDVSDSRITLSLSGVNARDVLKKGCGLDLHPDVFGPGQCAQSTLALAHVLMHQTAEDKKTGAATYRLFIHRSFAEYTWAWLEDAAGEYGVRVSAG